MPRDPIEYLKSVHACDPAIRWVRRRLKSGQSLQKIWKDARDPWKIWFLHFGADPESIVLPYWKSPVIFKQFARLPKIRRLT